MSDIPVNPSYVEGVAATGATILNKTKWLNGVTIYTADSSVLNAIEALPYVSGIMMPQKGGNNTMPERSGFKKPFFAHELYNQSLAGKDIRSGSSREYNYGPSYNQIAMLNGDQLHDMGYRGQGMVIAQLDAGFLNVNTLAVFDSLWDNNQILGTHDFVKGGSVTFDEHFHGAMVLSTMGGNYPGELIGTAPKASYWLLRSEDGASENIIEEFNWVSAAEFADSVGADIINSSLGYTQFDDPKYDHTYADMDGNTCPSTIGADMAASKGILVCNSLGNEGYSSWYYLSAPSDGDSVCGVGAVDADGNYAFISSHGPSYDGRVKPDLATQGEGDWVVDPFTGQFTQGSGTSFSSPVLAGISACLWQANPGKNNMQILQAMKESASQYNNPDDELGYGIPDMIAAKNILTIVESHNKSPEYLNVYPNPFINRIRVDLKQDNYSEGEFTISDLTGKQLISQKISAGQGREITISSLDRLPEGIYMAKAILNDKVLVSKIVKR